MTMARIDHSADHDWEDRHDDRDDRRSGRRAPGSLPIRVAELALRNPVTTGGLAVSLVMVAVTVANALANQPARHPHPLFDTRTVVGGDVRPAVKSPVHPVSTSPSPAATPASGVPFALPRPKPVSELDEGLVRDLQVVLAERGFYAGSIDGVVGPATAEAIGASERLLGVTPTGMASELLLAALRAAPQVVAQGAHPPQKQVAAQTRQAIPAPAPAPAPAPSRHSAPQSATTPPPTPSMRVATADAVAYPASREVMDYAETEVPVFTGSIRRAAREPLAKGGDEKLQKLQRALIAAGYGPLKADGRWDERSITAVRRYEADRGWPVTGRPSERLVWDLMPKSAQSRR
jgi:peptidoglycan hydrolase-like protein with peptidoglycan-binding domain